MSEKKTLRGWAKEGTGLLKGLFIDDPVEPIEEKKAEDKPKPEKKAEDKPKPEKKAEDKPKPEKKAEDKKPAPKQLTVADVEKAIEANGTEILRLTEERKKLFKQLEEAKATEMAKAKRDAANTAFIEKIDSMLS